MVYELNIVDNSFKSTYSSLKSNPYLGLSQYEDYFSEVFNRLFFAAASSCFGKYPPNIRSHTLNPTRGEDLLVLGLGGPTLPLFNQQVQLRQVLPVQSLTVCR